MRYEHDCDDCIYQGIVGNYDAYFHPNNLGGGEMVYRFGTDNAEDGYGLYLAQIVKRERVSND